MKAYTTEDGHIVTFRPDMNAERMENSAKRLEMPVFPKDRFVDAVVKTVESNIDFVPPYGSGATLYIRPYMFGSNAVIGTTLWQRCNTLLKTIHVCIKPCYRC